jgi:hypothetical protein
MGIPLTAACAALLAATQGPQAAAAEPAEQTGQPEQAEQAEQAKSAAHEDIARGGAGVAPVELIPRIELRHQFAQLAGGASASTTVTRLDVDFFGRLLLRYELPFARLANAAGEQVSGLGDIQLQAIAVMTASPRQVSVLIAGAELDTASAPQLGRGKQILVLGAAGGFKLRRWWLPYGAVEQQLSVAGDGARPDVNQLALRAGNVLFGPGFSWAKLDLDTAIDFTDDARTRLFVTVEAGRLLIGRVGLFIRGGTQAIGAREIDYTLGAGVRYLFRLEKKAPPP